MLKVLVPISVAPTETGPNPAPAAKLRDETFQLVDYFIPNESEASFYANHKVETQEDAKNRSQVTGLDNQEVLQEHGQNQLTEAQNTSHWNGLYVVVLSKSKV